MSALIDKICYTRGVRLHCPPSSSERRGNNLPGLNYFTCKPRPESGRACRMRAKIRWRTCRHIARILCGYPSKFMQRIQPLVVWHRRICLCQPGNRKLEIIDWFYIGNRKFSIWSNQQPWGLVGIRCPPPSSTPHTAGYSTNVDCHVWSSAHTNRPGNTQHTVCDTSTESYGK